MGLVSKDDGWRIPDALWERIEPLLPARPVHPLGCHNPRIPDRTAMNAILLVLRTGMQWNALDATGICSSSSAHRRFSEWTRAGYSSTVMSGGMLGGQVGSYMNEWQSLMATPLLPPAVKPASAPR